MLFFHRTISSHLFIKFPSFILSFTTHILFHYPHVRILQAQGGQKPLRCRLIHQLDRVFQEMDLEEFLRRCPRFFLHLGQHHQRVSFFFSPLNRKHFVLTIAIVIASETEQHKFYILDPASLNASVQSALALANSLAPSSAAAPNATLVVDTLVKKLVEDHPHVRWNTDWQNPDEWLFNNAGGAMGSMFLLHASITEYVLYVPSPHLPTD